MEPKQKIFNWLLFTFLVNLCCGYKPLELVVTSELPAAEHLRQYRIFTDLGNGQTKIDWTYKIVPKNFIARGLIKLVLMKNVNGLLNNALTTLKDDLESGRNKNASR